MKVEVFKTDISERWQAERIAEKLLAQFQIHDVHFDLEDYERILRIEAETIDAGKIISLLTDCGFVCAVL